MNHPVFKINQGDSFFRISLSIENPFEIKIIYYTSQPRIRQVFLCKFNISPIDSVRPCCYNSKTKRGGVILFFFFLNNEKITAMTLANYILERSDGTVTNLKLQKILYYVQGYFLAAFNRPLFPDEIQAWKFGPVVPSVYYEFSSYGPDVLVATEEATKTIENNCDADEIELINRVIDLKLQLPARQLVNATHSETPWLNATSNGQVIRPNTIITIDSMRDYFRTQQGVL